MTRGGREAKRHSCGARLLAPSPCGAVGMAIALATFQSRRRTGPRRLAGRAAWRSRWRRSAHARVLAPIALRGGRHGAATAPPARGPGTRYASGVGSAMASPPRLSFMLHLHSLDRDCHVCEHPQRARDPWPEASTSAKSGSMRTEYSRVPPGRAVVVEAERSRVERGRPRDRGPAHSGGCGRTSNARLEACGGTSNARTAKGAVELRAIPRKSTRNGERRPSWLRNHPCSGPAPDPGIGMGNPMTCW